MKARRNCDCRTAGGGGPEVTLVEAGCPLSHEDASGLPSVPVHAQRQTCKTSFAVPSGQGTAHPSPLSTSTATLPGRCSMALTTDSMSAAECQEKAPHRHEPSEKGTIYWSHSLTQGDVGCAPHSLALTLTPGFVFLHQFCYVKSNTRKDITKLFF